MLRTLGHFHHSDHEAQSRSLRIAHLQTLSQGGPPWNLKSTTALVQTALVQTAFCKGTCGWGKQLDSSGIPEHVKCKVLTRSEKDRGRERGGGEKWGH